jgi:hypothetical protein
VESLSPYLQALRPRFETMFFGRLASPGDLTNFEHIDDNHPGDAHLNDDDQEQHFCVGIGFVKLNIRISNVR